MRTNEPQFASRQSAQERVLVALELLAFNVAPLRAYFAALLMFLYNADILSEEVILKWAENPKKQRFSRLSSKFIGEIREVAEPMITWLK